jgi:hypothetical protein
MSDNSTYNLRPRPCKSSITDTGLPDRCRVTVVDLAATGCWRTIVVTSAEHNCGCFVGIGEKECPDGMDWDQFLRQWMTRVMATPLPAGVYDIVIVVERSPNKFASAKDNALTQRNNEYAARIARVLPISNERVLVCQELHFCQDMYWEPLAIVRGGLDLFDAGEQSD